MHDILLFLNNGEFEKAEMLFALYNFQDIVDHMESHHFNFVIKYLQYHDPLDYYKWHTLYQRSKFLHLAELNIDLNHYEAVLYQTTIDLLDIGCRIQFFWLNHKDCHTLIHHFITIYQRYRLYTSFFNCSNYPFLFTLNDNYHVLSHVLEKKSCETILEDMVKKDNEICGH